MHRYTLHLALSFLAAALIAGSLVAVENEDKANGELKVVKYNDLCKEVIGLKGKVVVVDFWADT
ncbi:MAG: hypothetical protein ACJ8FY_19195 [Gemmataceae bacterium]